MRVAGIRVGTVDDVSLQPDRKVLVKFDADRNVKLTTGTKAAVRYLNLVGDRYLELVDSPGIDEDPAAPERRYPVDRTAPALDLDLLLGGLKPVIQGLNPQDVNALTTSLVQILQGQGGNAGIAVLARPRRSRNALADNNQVDRAADRQPQEHRSTRSSKDGDKFSGAIDRLEQLVNGLSQDRDPDRHRHRVPRQRNGVAGRPARPGAAAAGRHDRSARTGLAPLLDTGKDRLDATIQTRCPRTTANSRGWAPTAPSSRTTSAGSPSAPATCRAAPWSSPGSSRKREGARSR